MTPRRAKWATFAGLDPRKLPAVYSSIESSFQKLPGAHAWKTDLKNQSLAFRWLHREFEQGAAIGIPTALRVGRFVLRTLRRRRV